MGFGKLYLKGTGTVAVPHRSLRIKVLSGIATAIDRCGAYLKKGSNFKKIYKIFEDSTVHFDLKNLQAIRLENIDYGKEVHYSFVHVMTVPRSQRLNGRTRYAASTLRQCELSLALCAN